MKIWTSRRRSSAGSTRSPSPARSSLRTPLISTSMRSPRRPSGRSDVLGMHFFSPANVMKLLEVVRGEKTAPDVLLTAMQLGKRIRKVPVVAGVCHGFIGNRMLMPRQIEATKLLLEGATPEQVDRVHVEFGMPMGPFQMADLAGVDIGWHRDPKRVENVRDALCAIDRWGQKKGAGFYDYDDKRRPIPSPVVQQIIEDFAAKQGVERREISRPGDRRAHALHNGQRGRENSRGRDRPARLRHRCRVGLWLWLAGLSRRPDVLGRQRRARRRSSKASSARKRAWARISASPNCCSTRPKRARGSRASARFLLQQS